LASNIDMQKFISTHKTGIFSVGVITLCILLLSHQSSMDEMPVVFTSSQTPVIPFLVWTQSRSGSEWFMSQLSKHSQICSSPYVCRMCPTESMHPRSNEAFTCYLKSFLATGQDYREYLSKMYDRDKALTGQWGEIERQPRAVGYKFTLPYIKWYNLTYGIDVMQEISDFGIKVVRLWRENKLNQFLSGHLAVKTGVWHVQGSDVQYKDKSKELGDAKLEVNTRKVLYELRNFQEMRERSTELLEQYNIPYTEVVYEECSDPDSGMEKCWCKVSEFLGLNCDEHLRKGTSSKVVKSNKKKQHERISNYKEVADVLIEHGYERFLDTT